MFNPKPLNLPPYPFKLTQKAQQLFIFDEIRKKNLVLTPEEWVRQHFVQYLMLHKKYPKSLIKLEGGLHLNRLQKRTDIVIYDIHGKPFILVECKASHIKIDQKVFDQVARYNFIHQVKYLITTNGLEHFYCEMDYLNDTYVFLRDIPDYK